MARIRSVHPGQWTDEEFVNCSAFGRLLALALRNEADDQGVFEWKPVGLKMRLFPGDSLDIEELLAELEANNQVQRFEVDGRYYGAIRNFRVYQRPKSPNSTYPLPVEFRKYVGLKSDDFGNSKTSPSANSVTVSEKVPKKGKQMEEGGGRRKEKKILTPQPAENTPPRAREEPPPKAAADFDSDIVQQTHDRIVEIAGAEPVKSPAWMATTVVRGWLADGIEPGTIVGAVEQVMTRRSDPPRGPNYFTNAVREAHENAGQQVSEADAEVAQRRARLKGFIANGHWGDWGEQPTVDAAKAELESLLGVTER